MNREILFKGKTIKEGKWIEGSLIIDTRGNYYIGEYIPLNKDINIVSGRTQGKTLNQFVGIGFAMVDKDTVCQYTGATDKNGNKVFELDVVKVKITQKEDIGTYGNCKYKVGVIVYNEDFALFTCKNNFMNFINWAFNEYEVIGNFFDNKERLKQADR